MIMRMTRRMFLAILMLPRAVLKAFTAWQIRRPGPTKYIKIPTPEEIEQAQVAARDPNNPNSFAALAARSNAKAKEVEARLAVTAVVPLHTWRSEDFNPDSGAKESEPRFSISRVWEHHIAETGVHPLEDDQTCDCKARHIPMTNTPVQIPEETEKD